MQYTKILREILKKYCNLTLYQVYKDKLKKFTRYKVVCYGHKPSEINRIVVTSRFSVHIEGGLTSIVEKLEREIPVLCSHCTNGFIYEPSYAIIINVYPRKK